MGGIQYSERWKELASDDALWGASARVDDDEGAVSHPNSNN